MPIHYGDDTSDRALALAQKDFAAREADKASGEGWWRPATSRVWHYFGKDHRSLCSRWMHMGASLELGNDDSDENCATCRKKVAARRARQNER